MTPPYAELDLDAIVDRVVGFHRFDQVVQAFCDALTPPDIPIHQARTELFGVLRPGRTESTVHTAHLEGPTP